MIEIDPITRIMFYGKENEKVWLERIQKIQDAYYKTEFEAFKRGFRRVYVAHLDPAAVDTALNEWYKEGMLFFGITKTRQYSGFSHKHLEVGPGDLYYYYGELVKQDDKEAAELFLKASGEGDHITQGKLLGYPKCCTEWFQNAWKESVDPMFEGAKRSDGAVMKNNVVTTRIHPFNNGMLRYWGIQLNPWIHCSGTCKESIKLGKKWYDLMYEIDPQATKWAYELLSMPMTWDCYRSIALINNDIFHGMTNSDYALVKKKVVNLGWK